MTGFAAAAAGPIANTHATSQPYVIDPPNVIGRGKNETQYSIGDFYWFTAKWPLFS